MCNVLFTTFVNMVVTTFANKWITTVVIVVIPTPNVIEIITGRSYPNSSTHHQEYVYHVPILPQYPIVVDHMPYDVHCVHYM